MSKLELLAGKAPIDVETYVEYSKVSYLPGDVMD